MYLVIEKGKVYKQRKNKDKISTFISNKNKGKLSQMPIEIKRKLYSRGSSYETTIPKPLLFKLDADKKHSVIFKYDPQKDRWYLDFEELKIKK